MTELTHIFTESGLGQAPFTCVAVVDTQRVTCSCDHCGTGIRYRFELMSADGKSSKVGSDCIHKSGDRGLISVANLERRKRDAEKRAAKREAARLASLQAQRDRNRGLTDYEVAEQKRAAYEARRASYAAQVRDMLGPVLAVLDSAAETSCFCYDIAAQIRGGQLPRGRARSIVVDICGRDAGRRNSKAYIAACDDADTLLELAEEVAVPE